MGKLDVAMIAALGRNLELFTGEAVRKTVMDGSEQITASSSKRQIAVWVKGAMDRLDGLVDEQTRAQVMARCGHGCARVNQRIIETAKARRKTYLSLDAFLAAEQRSPMPGTMLRREGDVLYVVYTPQAFTRPMRCYCSLLRGLPADETVSPTYCLCGKGFVEKKWEALLGRPVKVKLLQSVVSGAPECTFAVYL